MVSLMKSLLVKGFGIVNDCTDTYLILDVQSCRLQLEPSLDTMAPETVSLVMQTLHKSTLDEAFIIRQNVGAIVVSKDLLPPMKKKRIAAKLSQKNEGCSVASIAKYMFQKCFKSCLSNCSADLPASLSMAQTSLA